MANIKQDDMIRLQFDCTGFNGRTVKVRTVLTAQQLGIGAARQAPAVKPIEFNAARYAELLGRSIDPGLTSEERRQAAADAQGLVEALHAGARKQLEGGVLTPGQSIVKAVVDHAVAGRLSDENGSPLVFSREDSDKAFRLSEKELNVSAPSAVKVGDDTVNLYLVTATATWGN